MLRATFKNWPVVLALVVIAGARVDAERLEKIPNPKTRDNTWITDLTGRLKGQTKAQVNKLITELEKDTSAEMGVAVINSLDGQPERQLATDLLRRWGVGKRGVDNGLLFLWAVNDRRVVVEVGYGLEPILPDGKVGAILDQYVMPRFKAGEFDRGVAEGLGAFAAVIRNQPQERPAPAAQSQRPAPIAQPYKGSPDDGGTFIWLLGILFIGIGSAVGYRFWRRYHSRACEKCRAKMQRIANWEDDELLEPPMRLEENLRSVDYDIWKCPACSHQITARYPKWFSRQSQCPMCNYRTCSTQKVTLRAATTEMPGMNQVTERCEYCSYHLEYAEEIPKIATSSNSSGGGWSGGSGGGSGFSSGGSGGGGGGSFGGGSSGGGGASREY